MDKKFRNTEDALGEIEYVADALKRINHIYYNGVEIRSEQLISAVRYLREEITNLRCEIDNAYFNEDGTVKK